MIFCISSHSFEYFFFLLINYYICSLSHLKCDVSFRKLSLQLFYFYFLWQFRQWTWNSVATTFHNLFLTLAEFKPKKSLWHIENFRGNIRDNQRWMSGKKGLVFGRVRCCKTVWYLWQKAGAAMSCLQEGAPPPNLLRSKHSWQHFSSWGEESQV